MSEKTVIMPMHLNPGMISVLSKHYEPDALSNELIQRWFYQMYTDHLIDPEYLFVSEKGRTELQHILARSHATCFRILDIYAIDALWNRYPNQWTGTILHVVTLPTLPDDTLLVGNLVLVEEASHE